MHFDTRRPIAEVSISKPDAESEPSRASRRSLPVSRTLCDTTPPEDRGDVAQLGERLVRNEEVGGSSPLISTMLGGAGRSSLGPASKQIRVGPGSQDRVLRDVSL